MDWPNTETEYTIGVTVAVTAAFVTWLTNSLREKFYWIPDRLLDRGIRITSPLSGSVLDSDKRPLGNGFSYRVEGTLRQLPKDHEIWLLTQEHETGHVRPQGFFAAEYDSNTRKWVGRINGYGNRKRLIAVVAPPTSQDFFKYWQRMGDKTGFAPLTRVPLECRNQVTVQMKMQ